MFLATFLGYLEKEELLSKDDTAAMLKSKLITFFEIKLTLNKVFSSRLKAFLFCNKGTRFAHIDIAFFQCVYVLFL